MSEVIQRVTPGAATGGFDEQGNPVTGDATSADVEIIAFAPQVTDEVAEAFGSQVLSAGTVFAEAGTAFASNEQLVIRGDTWQVEGNPRVWVGLTDDSPSGVEVLVRRVS